MARKSTIVVSTKIPRGEYEYLLDRVKYLHKSNSIKNCTKASYMKYLIDNDLGDDHDRYGFGRFFGSRFLRFHRRTTRWFLRCAVCT